MKGFFLVYDVEHGYDGEILSQIPEKAFSTYEKALEYITDKEWEHLGLEDYRSYKECLEKMKVRSDEYIEYIPVIE